MNRTLSGVGSSSVVGRKRAGGGHCPTCTCNGRGDLMQKETAPQGVAAKITDLEKRVGRIASAMRTKQGLVRRR